MPYRVNACFEDFIKFEVNLDPERVKIARTTGGAKACSSILPARTNK